MRESLVFCLLLTTVLRCNDDILNRQRSRPDDYGLILDSDLIFLEENAIGNAPKTIPSQELQTYKHNEYMTRSNFGQECEHGYYFSIDCNTCVCVVGRMYICTMRVCKGSNSTPKRKDKLSKCSAGQWVPHDPGKADCNNCYCTTDKIALCFIDICHTPKKRLALTLNRKLIRPSKCTYGTEMSEGKCTICKCKYDGWHCRRDPKCNEVGYDVCFAGEAITQATPTKCTTCRCMIGMWQCIAEPEPCEDRGLLLLPNKKQCRIDKIYANTKKRCSFCFCDDEDTANCLTDMTCNDKKKNTLSKKKCDPLKCLNFCYVHQKRIGFCSSRIGCKCYKEVED